jgi:uncharacterized membrane protein
VQVLPFVALGFAGVGMPKAVGAPLNPEFSRYQGAFSSVVLMLCVIAGLIASTHIGDSAPFAYLTLFNPLEIALLSIFALLLFAMPRVPELAQLPRTSIVSTAAFWLLTTASLRFVIHQFEPELLSSSSPMLAVLWTKTGQAALALMWALLGCGAMLWGHVKSRRALWMMGAGLMAVVLAKILLIDRRNLGDVAGILVMLAVGGLLAAVGYFAPAPPETPENEDHV